MTQHDGDQPLLFHTGPKRLFTLVHEAVQHLIQADRLCFIVLSHSEADECGSLNEWLAAARRAMTLCSKVVAMVFINDVAGKPAWEMADGEKLVLGKYSVKWLDAPHLPHGWETGYLMEAETGTMFCGDLFTQGGNGAIAMTEGDILEPSEAFRTSVGYFSHSTNTVELIDKLTRENPNTLARMHGSAWMGNRADMLCALGR